MQQIHWVSPACCSALECSRTLWSALECIDGIGDEATRHWIVEPWGAHTTIDGLVVRCSGERGLPMAPKDHTRVDFDLDYFDREVDTAQVAVARVGALLGELGLREYVDTATLSISNGFLDASGAVLPELLVREFGIEAPSIRDPIQQSSILRKLYRSTSKQEAARDTDHALPPAFDALTAVRCGEVDEALSRLHGLAVDRETGWAHYEVRLALIGCHRYADVVDLPLRLERAADTTWVRAACLQAIAYERLGRWPEAGALLDDMIRRWPMLLNLYQLAKLAALASGDRSRAELLTAASQRLQRIRDEKHECRLKTV